MRDEDAGLSPSKVRRQYVVAHRGALRRLIVGLMGLMTRCDKCEAPALWRHSGRDKFSATTFRCDAHKLKRGGAALPHADYARIGEAMVKVLSQ